MNSSPRQIKWAGALLLMAVLASLAGNIVSSYLMENFDSDIVNKIRDDSDITQKIGSYQEHTFTYDKLGGRDDSLDFQIKILGEKKILTITGIAVKVDDQWAIRGQKKIINETSNP